MSRSGTRENITDNMSGRQVQKICKANRTNTRVIKVS